MKSFYEDIFCLWHLKVYIVLI